jgi:hypothetical protein
MVIDVLNSSKAYYPVVYSHKWIRNVVHLCFETNVSLAQSNKVVCYEHVVVLIIPTRNILSLDRSNFTSSLEMIGKDPIDFCCMVV